MSSKNFHKKRILPKFTFFFCLRVLELKYLYHGEVFPLDFEYDAFDEGIEPGGLRSRNEIKVLVCYLLKSIEQPISKQLINEILQENSLANYFEINQAYGQDMIRMIEMNQYRDVRVIKDIFGKDRILTANR